MTANTKSPVLGVWHDTPGACAFPPGPSGDAGTATTSPAEAACLWAVAEGECAQEDVASTLAFATRALLERWPYGAPEACVIRFDGAEYAAGDACGAGGRVSADLAVGGVVRGVIALQFTSSTADFLAPAAGFLLKVADLLSRALVRRLAEDRPPVELHATVQRDVAAEAAVRQSEAQLRAIITHMPVMLHAFDEEGRIVVWNRECEEVTGYTASEMVGNPRALELLYPDPEQRARITRGLQRDHADYRGWELKLSRKDGSTRTIEWSSIAKRFPIAGWAAWGIGVDVSHQRGALEERRAIDGQLSDQQRHRAIGTLAAGVAHEINNPANIIMNYARLIADEAPEGSQTKDDALQIVAESERIAHIVSELHALSAVGTSVPSLASVAQILENVIRLARGTLAQEGIAVTTSIPDGLPLLQCRPAEVGQVLQNLLENARDALNTRYPGNDPDKQLIIAAQRFSRDGRPWARVTVEDHGVGIPDEIRPRIFDPFFSTKPRAVGTGLGLYIAHRLVAQHGGQITVDSQLDRGTRIHLELPARETSAEMAAGTVEGDRDES